MMKKVLAFDIDQTLNVAKTPITKDIAELLVRCLDHFEICPISGQKFDQFLIQIVNQLPTQSPTQALEHRRSSLNIYRMNVCLAVN